MCGIVFAIVERGKASTAAFSRYKEQKNRGKEGYGAVCADRNVVNAVYRSENEEGIQEMLGNDASMALFHHRKPTSTPNFEECTHPILVSNELLEYDYYVVHNGVISNAYEMYDSLVKLGFEFTTEIAEGFMTRGRSYFNGKKKFNDSEAFAIDLAIAIEEGRGKLKSLGSIAFVALQVNKETKEVETVFYGRNPSNPLVYSRRKGTLIIASEGKGEQVAVHALHAYETATGSVTVSELDIGLKYVVPEKKEPRPESFTRMLPAGSGGGTAGPASSVLEQVAENARRRNATNDIIKNQIFHLSKKDRKRLKYGIESRTITVLDRFGKYNQLQYVVKGECLLGTTIHEDDAELSMLPYHWEWYFRVTARQKELVRQMKKHRNDGDFDKEAVVRQLKNCARELEIISDSVNLVAEAGFRNKFQLDEPVDGEERDIPRLWDMPRKIAIN